MRKLLACFTAVLALSACTTLNKNTVSYQASKYDSSKYYVVGGDGKTKNEASARALDNMRQAIVQNAPELAQDPVLTDLMANAKVDKVWRDKSLQQTHYLALAVLPRENAHHVLAQEMDKTDAQLSGLDAHFASPAEPLADLRIAYRMQPLISRRTVLDDTYQFLSKTHESYNADKFFPYKNKLKEKMAAVLVGVDVQGRESKVMITHVVDALNKMGLGVVDISDPEKVLSVEILTDVDNYDSKKIDGLQWASSNVSVSLVDATRGVTFSRFNVYERAGTSRVEESMRRSMEAAGEQAATQITARLAAYLNTK